jgi:hypothetical protein
MENTNNIDYQFEQVRRWQCTADDIDEPRGNSGEQKSWGGVHDGRHWLVL